MNTVRVLCICALLGIVLGGICEAGDANNKVKVFILAGQSNMVGAGKVPMDPKRNEGKGTLEYMVKKSDQKDKFKHTVDASGKWRVRKDVWIWTVGGKGGARKGGLSVGYGSRGDTIGPEFQFGHVMGDYFDSQVLIIKTSWGGKTLAGDFRPPSSGGQVGSYYRDMLKLTREVLANLKTNFPGYAGQGYEISGFGWHQGWNDGCNGKLVTEYEKNMANFIRDIRKEFKVEKMPFVIANSGFGGRANKNSRRVGIMEAQLAVAKYDEFKGNVFTVETRDFFRPPEESPSKQGYHWNGNAETYFLIGDAMGREMIKLIEGSK